MTLPYAVESEDPYQPTVLSQALDNSDDEPRTVVRFTCNGREVKRLLHLRDYACLSGTTWHILLIVL